MSSNESVFDPVTKVALPIRVLYIDDDPDFLEIVKVILERNGEFSVVTTTSGKEALEILRSGKYDVILSDYRMTRMGGDEFLVYARVIDQRIPFIYFTGKECEEVAIDRIHDDSIYYLHKGGDPVVQFSKLKEQILIVMSKRADAPLPAIRIEPSDRDPLYPE